MAQVIRSRPAPNVCSAEVALSCDQFPIRSGRPGAKRDLGTPGD